MSEDDVTKPPSNAVAKSSGRRKGSLKTRIIVIAVIALLGWYAWRMSNYDPNFVTVVDQANRFVLKSGDILVLAGVEVPSRIDTQLGEPGAQHVEKLILNRYIRVEEATPPRDEAGQILAYVYYTKDGKEVMLNEEVLRLGYGRLPLVYRHLKYAREFEAAQAEAKENKLGFWSPNYKPPGS